MGADELKSYFDSSPNELKNSINSVIGDLTSQEGAKNIGFTPSVRVPANTVQDAVENVQLQLNSIALGSVPEGSITKGKLASDVLSQFTDIQNNFTATSNRINETSATLSAADNAINFNLQNQINAHTNSINGINSTLALKTGCIFGKYKGNDQASQFINLGYTPKAVLVLTESGQTGENSTSYGGFAFSNAPCKKYNGTMILDIVPNGFQCYQNTREAVYCNYINFTYHYITFN